MDICIIKSASREVYFQQNLALVSKPHNEDMVLRYRWRWVDPCLREQSLEVPARAVLVFCDPPHYHCVAVRELTVYHSEVTDEALTLFARCGPFVSPREGSDWAREFRAQYPLDGTPDGRFVLDIHGFRPCPIAGEDVQSEAWRAVVNLLTCEEKYKHCFFFLNEGIHDERLIQVSPSELQVGKSYTLRLLSYNPHIPPTVRERARMRIVTDGMVMSASLSEPRVPPDRVVEVTLVPKASGRTRVEVRVPEAGEAVSYAGLDARCVEAPESAMQAVRGAGTSQVAWAVYTRIAALRPDDDELLGTLLSELFGRDDMVENPQIAGEFATRMWNLGRPQEVASLLDDLPEQSIALMTQEAMLALILSACRARHVFPSSPELRKIDLSEPHRWSRFRDMIAECPPSVASSILLSVMSEQRDVLIDENDMAELLQSENVLKGFDTTSKVRTVAEWLRDRAEPGVLYRFLLDRISALDVRDVDILTCALEAGSACQGHDLSDILVSLVVRLTETGKCDQAVELLLDKENALRVSDDEYAHLLARAAGGCTSPAVAVSAYITAAKRFRMRADFPDANKCVSCARALAQLHAVGDLERIEEEQAEIEEYARALQASAQATSSETVLERARLLCRGKRIAIVGGQTRMPWIPELESDLSAKVDWYPCRRAHRVEQNDALMASIRNGSVAAVVQVRWAPHLSALKNACRSCGVPYATAFGGRDSAIHALASLAAGLKSGMP